MKKFSRIFPLFEIYSVFLEKFRHGFVEVCVCVEEGEQARAFP